jgi:predicted signal transduction protein with EAL and GGDEF domain
MFSESYLKFIRSLALLTLLLIAGGFALSSSDVISPYFNRVLLNISLFFLIISAVIYFILSRSIGTPKNKAFLKGVMLTNILKIVLSLLFAVWLLVTFEKQQLIVILMFFGLYLLYSVFVMTYLFYNLRQISERHKNAENNTSSN